MTTAAEHSAIKVPEVTLLFWVIKIDATMLGETGGDAVSMSLLGNTIAVHVVGREHHQNFPTDHLSSNPLS